MKGKYKKKKGKFAKSDKREEGGGVHNLLVNPIVSSPFPAPHLGVDFITRAARVLVYFAYLFSNNDKFVRSLRDNYRKITQVRARVGEITKTMWVLEGRGGGGLGNQCFFEKCILFQFLSIDVVVTWNGFIKKQPRERVISGDLCGHSVLTRTTFSAFVSTCRKGGITL